MVGEEKSMNWYNSLADRDFYKIHYTKSVYYFFWTVLVDRIVISRVKSILDIGCGSGQLSEFLRDKGLEKYHGLDFSSRFIEMARKRVPEFKFTEVDIFETNLLENADYDSVLCTEFLEHIEQDLIVIKRIKPGTLCFLSVPNFPHASHVRHFKNSEEVFDRYGKFFEECSVDSFKSDEKGYTIYFLLQGVKK